MYKSFAHVYHLWKGSVFVSYCQALMLLQTMIREIYVYYLEVSVCQESGSGLVGFSLRGTVMVAGRLFSPEIDLDGFAFKVLSLLAEVETTPHPYAHLSS